MRYLSWDVLLFPEDSKVPVQEFRTACFVARDPESVQPQAPIAGSLPYALDHVSPIPLPIVSSFVPTLPQGFPFRVSIHSWEVPRPSRAIEQSAYQEAVMFEARVFVDGSCVAGTLFKHTDLWPQIIDTSSHLDKNGNHDSLRFPAFHQEMVNAIGWDAGDSIGRVKVTIAEGFAKAQSNSPFERVRNIVSFTFQHAPLAILESSGIAWPNPGMWYQTYQPLYTASSIAVRKSYKADPDAHSHSPRRRVSSGRNTMGMNGAAVSRVAQSSKPMPPPAVPGRGHLLKDNDWTTLPTMPDPFLDNGQGQGYQNFTRRSGSEDLSMPDYSHSITPASSRNISGSNNMHRKGAPVTEPAADEQYDMLLNAITPPKDGTCGTFAPANSRRSSTVPTSAPQFVTRPSVAAEARVASYTQRHGRSVSVKAPAKSAHRETSDVSMKSRFSEGAAESQDTGAGKIYTKPAGSIKGKKEGRGSDFEAKQREISTDPSGRNKKENAKTGSGTSATLSDGKRKRNLTVPDVPAAAKLEDVQSSPTRKISRKEGHGGHPVATVDDLTDDDVAVKAPLQALENV